MRTRLLAFSLACLVAALSLAASAGATTFCVAAPSCVGGGGTAEPDLQTALTAARPVNGSPGPDAVVVGPGTYTGPFSYLDSDVLTITGAGSGETILTTSGSGAITLSLYGNAGDAVSDLTVRASGAEATALGLGSGTAEGVAAESLGPSGRGAVELGGGTFSHGSASVESTDKYNSHVVRTEGASTISDAVLSGATGVLEIGASGALVERARISATGFGVSCYTVHCALRDALISMSGGSGQGVVAQCLDSSHSASVSIRNATFQGAAYADVTAACNAAPASAVAIVDSSILEGADHALDAEQAGGEVDPGYDDYDPATSVTLAGGSIGADVGSIDAGPAFLDPGAADFRLRADSPLIDAGNPAALAVDESTTDLAGQPRVVNGRRDIGAFEYQPPPPAPPPPGGGAEQTPTAGEAQTPTAGEGQNATAGEGPAPPALVPRCRVGARRKQPGFARSKQLRTAVRCSLAATVRETAVARLRLGHGRSARRLTLRLGSASAELAAGSPTALAIRPRPAVRKRLLELVEQGARVMLSLKLTITDAAGNRSVTARTIRRLAL